MQINLSYDEGFDRLISRLREKYPAELFDIDGIGKQLDMHQFAKEFYNITGPTADVSTDANANVSGKDVITYTFEMPKAFHRLNSYYLLWKELKKEYGPTWADLCIEMQISGDFYINDAWDVGRPYCFNFSTYDIALHGLPMGDRVKPVAPKSLYAFVRQVEQFVVYAANSTLGATGLADLFIVMAWYVDRLYGSHYQTHSREDYCTPADYCKDHKIELGCPQDYVREIIASFIYTLNWQFRGNQSPFTNVSLYDQKFLEELVPHYLIQGKAPQIETVQMLQQMFMETMNEELARSPITFPVTTACFSVDEAGEIQDYKFTKVVAEHNLKFGFINIYCGKTSTLSSCCRLRSDGETLGYANSFGAGSTKIGSLGVVTLNLPRLARKAKGDLNKFLDDLENFVRVSSAINQAKRAIIKKRVDRGNLPLYTLGHMDLARQYNTVGITGLWEAFLEFEAPYYEPFALDVIEVINKTNDVVSSNTGAPHNCEQVPAESSSVKLVEKDKLLGETPGVALYSNQFIPLHVNANVLDRINVQGALDKHFSGGAILHVNIDEPLSDPAQMVELIKHCARKGVVYWAVNYALHRCEDGHITAGGGERCAICGKPITDTFTRVVGFLTNVKNWNKARRAHDWPTRKFHKTKELLV